MEQLICELVGLVNYEFPVATCTEKQSLLRHVTHMHHEKEKLPREFFSALLQHATAATESLPNVIQVHRKGFTNQGDEFDWDIAVIGDLHGQFDDAKLVFTDPRFGRLPSETNHFIFNGDVVDRGKRAIDPVTYFAGTSALSGMRALHPQQPRVRKLDSGHGFPGRGCQKVRHRAVRRLPLLFRYPAGGGCNRELGFRCARRHKQGVFALTIEQLNSLDRHCEPEMMPLVLYELLWAGKLAVYNRVKTFSTCYNCGLYLQIPRMQRGSHRRSEPQREQWTASAPTPRLPS
jgi:hypothetical protein